MGFGDTLRNLVGGGGKDDEPDVDVSSDFEGIDEEIDGGDDIDSQTTEPGPEPEEEEMMEWDSAYKFAEWYLEEYGFANMRDFGEKAVMMRLSNDPMFRDRISTGMETLKTIRQAREEMRAIKGNEGSDKNYEQMANEIENANRVIEGVRKLEGEDEMIVQEGMNLASRAIDAIASRGGGGGSANVDSSMGRTDREI